MSPVPNGVLPGDFACVRMRSQVGRLIRLGEQLNGDGFGDYEHAIVYIGKSPLLDDGSQEDLILEAEPGGALVVPFHYAKQDCLWSSRNPDLDLVPAQRERALTVGYALRGTPYSFLDYLALALRRLHFPGWTGLRRYVNSTHHEICSQMVVDFRNRLGSYPFPDKDQDDWPGDVTPLELANLIMKGVVSSRASEAPGHPGSPGGPLSPRTPPAG